MAGTTREKRAEGKVQMNLDLTPTGREALRSLARSRGVAIGAMVEAMVARESDDAGNASAMRTYEIRLLGTLAAKMAAAAERGDEAAAVAARAEISQLPMAYLSDGLGALWALLAAQQTGADVMKQATEVRAMVGRIIVDMIRMEEKK